METKTSKESKRRNFAIKFFKSAKGFAKYMQKKIGISDSHLFTNDFQLACDEFIEEIKKISKEATSNKVCIKCHRRPVAYLRNSHCRPCHIRYCKEYHRRHK